VQFNGFIFLNVRKSINYTASDLQVSRPRLEPSPAFEGSRTDAPPTGEFDLVEVANRKFGSVESCWERRRFAGNGEL
jgi:hypothetical protein